MVNEAVKVRDPLSRQIFEPDHSDLSQSEHNWNKELLRPAYTSSKIGDADYPGVSANSCYCGYPVEDHAFGFCFEPDHSDLSQSEHNWNEELLRPAYTSSKIGDADYPGVSANCCYCGFPVEDHAFGFWSY
ncbi:unnamed protein product [Fraxinus pennsylvanica]|uniref:Uncharacterized protein n=1 Tax=Fraxinus pennsylvanica TaxID=56036 RepID=A0AAD1YM18_9LAMI|nr:unnamed protein product [Fraxinus pennsylvanica]